MLDAKETLQAIQIMGKTYPTTGSSLVADTPFHFLMAVILMAPTTNKTGKTNNTALFFPF